MSYEIDYDYNEDDFTTETGVIIDEECTDGYRDR